MVQAQEGPEFKVILNLRKFEENLGYMGTRLGNPTNPTEASNRKSRLDTDEQRQPVLSKNNHPITHTELYDLELSRYSLGDKNHQLKGGREANKLDFMKMKVTIKNCQDKGWVRWSTPLVLALRRWRLADLFEFKVSLA